MQIFDRAIGPLRVLLVWLFVGLVFGQTVSLPGQFRHLASEEPDLAYLRWPLTVVSVLELVCAQVVIVCIWKLLAMVRTDRIFSEDAFVWVDTIVWAMLAGWVLLLGTAGYLISLADDPGFPILLIGLSITLGVLVLLMMVMRLLVRKAAVLQADLETVI